MKRSSDQIRIFEQDNLSAPTRTVLAKWKNLVSAGQVAQVPVDKLATDLSLRDVDKITLHGVVQVVGIDNLTIQKTVLRPADLAGALLVDQEEAAELLRLNLEETGKLLEVHGGVKSKVRLDGWGPHVGLDLVHEDLEVVLDWVDVELWVVKVWWGWGDELWAGSAEEFLVDWERFLATALELQELVTVLLTESGVDGVVQAGWVESNAEGDERVHLVVLLGVGLGSLLEVLGTGDVDQDVGEHADGIGVAAHHHVRESDIVVCGEVSGHDTGKHGLLVELNVVEGLQGEGEVTEEAVDAEESNDGEVSQHAVKWLGSVVSGNSHWLLVALHCSKLLVDLGSLDERVQNVEDGVASPCVWVLAEELNLLSVVSSAGNLLTVGAELVELVDELINDIPSPVVLENVSPCSVRQLVTERCLRKVAQGRLVRPSSR